MVLVTLVCWPARWAARRVRFAHKRPAECRQRKHGAGDSRQADGQRAAGRAAWLASAAAGVAAGMLLLGSLGGVGLTVSCSLAHVQCTACGLMLVVVEHPWRGETGNGAAKRFSAHACGFYLRENVSDATAAISRYSLARLTRGHAGCRYRRADAALHPCRVNVLDTSRIVPKRGCAPAHVQSQSC